MAALICDHSINEKVLFKKIKMNSSIIFISIFCTILCIFHNCETISIISAYDVIDRNSIQSPNDNDHTVSLNAIKADLNHAKNKTKVFNYTWGKHEEGMTF